VGEAVVSGEIKRLFKGWNSKTFFLCHLKKLPSFFYLAGGKLFQPTFVHKITRIVIISILFSQPATVYHHEYNFYAICTSYTSSFQTSVGPQELAGEGEMRLQHSIIFGTLFHEHKGSIYM